MGKKTKLFSIIMLLVMSVGVLWGSLSGGAKLVYAAPLTSDSGYTVLNQHIDIKVQPDNSYVVTETMEINFSALSRGIYKYVPYKNTIYKDLGDGKAQPISYNARVDLVSIKGYLTNPNSSPTTAPVAFAQQVVEYTEGNMVVLVRETNYFTGKRFYQMQYTFDVGNDRYANGDEFYYNLNGPFVDTSVNNLTFTITFPTALNVSDLISTPDEVSGTTYPIYVYKGAYGSSTTPTSQVQVEINQNKTVINGHITGKVNPFEAVTIRVPLKEGYYTGVKQFTVFEDILTCVVVVLFSLLSVFMVYKWINRKEVVAPVEFYPPEDMDPIKMIGVLEGGVSQKHYASLVVYYASKGYLKIIDEDGVLSLQKIKDINDDAPSYQKTMFEALFDSVELPRKKEERQAVLEKALANLSDQPKLAKKLEENDAKLKEYQPVKLSALEKNTSFGGSMASVARMGTATYAGKRVEKKSVGKGVAAIALSLLPMIAFCIYYETRTRVLGDFLWVASAALIIIAILSVGGMAMGARNYKNAQNSGRGYKVFVIVALIVFVFIASLVIFAKLESIVDPLYIRFIVLLAPLFVALLAPKTIVLTDEYHELYGKIVGFKKTITLTEKKRIELLVKEDPSYYYDILPYAYVLGISKEFTKNFEGLAMAQPNWYVNSENHAFNFIVWNSMINSSLRSFSNNTMRNISVHNASGKSFGGFGGGGFGGGFSGGGFGGGGMGRA